MQQIPAEISSRCPILEEVKPSDAILGTVPDELRRLYWVGEVLLTKRKRLFDVSNQKNFDDERAYALDDNALAMRIMPLDALISDLTELFWLCLRGYFHKPVGYGWNVAVRKDWTAVLYKKSSG